MKKGITIEARFFSAAGKFIGASCFDFEGTPEAIESVIHEDETLDEGILEFLAVRAGIRRFGRRVLRYSYESQTYDIEEKDDFDWIPDEADPNEPFFRPDDKENAEATKQ